MAVYTDDNTWYTPNAKGICIYIYIHTILNHSWRIHLRHPHYNANASQKRNRSRGKNTNLRNQFVKFYFYHLLENSYRRRRRKKKCPGREALYTTREHVELPQRCARVAFPRRGNEPTNGYESFQIKIKRWCVFLGVLAISTEREECVEQASAARLAPLPLFHSLERPTDQPWTNLSRQPCSPVFHTCFMGMGCIPGTNISRRSFRFVKQAPYVPSIRNVHETGVGGRVKGGADRGRGWVSTLANTQQWYSLLLPYCLHRQQIENSIFRLFKTSMKFNFLPRIVNKLMSGIYINLWISSFIPFY